VVVLHLQYCLATLSELSVDNFLERELALSSHSAFHSILRNQLRPGQYELVQQGHFSQQELAQQFSQVETPI
jgi:hypothetical protein